MRAAEMANTTGLEERRSTCSVGARRVDFGRFTTSIFTLFYYALSPLYGARTPPRDPRPRPMNRALGDAKLELRMGRGRVVVGAVGTSTFRGARARRRRASRGPGPRRETRTRTVVPRGSDAEVA